MLMWNMCLRPLFSEEAVYLAYRSNKYYSSLFKDIWNYKSCP